jgi:DNA polymerase-3 subunit gamma/tau
VLQPLDEVYRRGCDLRRFTRDLLEHMRNLAVAKASGGTLVPDLAVEEAEALRAQAARMPAEDCDRAFRILLETDEEVARTPYPKLVLEMALLRLAALPPLLPVDELLQRLADLEGRMRGPAAAARPRPAVASSAPPEPAAAGRALAPRSPAIQGAPPAGPQSWEAFVAFACGERARLAEHLSKCVLLSLDDGTVAIEAPRGFRANYLAEREHVAQIEELATRFFGRPMRARVQAAESDAVDPPAPPPTTAELTSAALQNPAVQAAVSILGGEIAAVRARRPRREEET